MAFTTETYPAPTSDNVFAMAVLEDRRVVMFSLFHYNTTLFERWGVYMLIANPDGTSYWAADELPENSISFSQDCLSISSGSNEVAGAGMRYRIVWNAGEVSINLTYENYLPPWIAGDGVYALGDKDFQKSSVFSPWAAVNGTVTAGGFTSRVRGEGVAEKSLIVNDLRRLNPELVSMRVFGVYRNDETGRRYTPDLHIGLLDSTTHPAYGSNRIPRLFVARDGRWLFATDDYEIMYLEQSADTDLLYQYPTTFSLTAASEGFRLEGIYHATTLFNVTDVLDELPRWLRAIVLLFVDRPVYFRSHGYFEGTLTSPDGSTEELYLAGPYEYVVVK